MRILIVDSGRDLNGRLRKILERDGYGTDTVYDGNAGLDCAHRDIYDLILLNISPPEQDGLDFLQRLREDGVKTPILLLACGGSPQDRIRGLDCGADNYLTKPFDPAELLACVRALTRRRAPAPEPRELVFHDLALEKGQLRCGQCRARLSLKEFQVMECLMTCGSAILSRQQVCEKVWGCTGETEYNSVEVYMTFLRRKLRSIHSHVQIRSIRNVGYYLKETA